MASESLPEPSRRQSAENEARIAWLEASSEEIDRAYAEAYRAPTPNFMN